MTIIQRCGRALYETGAAGFEALQRGTAIAFCGVGGLYVLLCLVGAFTGPAVVWVIFWGLWMAVTGFLAIEAFVVLPVALVVALATGLSVVSGCPVRVAVLERPAPAPVAARALGALPVAHARCPVCATSLAHDVVQCARCETPHHRECWEYAGRCAVFACQ